MNKRITIGTIVVFAAATVFAAGPWYVDVTHPNAADTNVEGRGTEALPFKTIQAALDNSSFESGDTVYVKPGIYKEGGKEDDSTTRMMNRVYITKDVVLKSTGGKKDTVILGQHDTIAPDGIGDGAVRCICVRSGSNIVIDGFTLKDGSVKTTTGTRNKRGGGLYMFTVKREVRLVDCIFENCIAYEGGGVYGGVAVRCLFDGCCSSEPGSAVADSWLFSCVITKCIKAYPISKSTAVNTTFALNEKSALPNASTSAAYNCVIAGNGDDGNVGGTSSSIWENSTRTQDQGLYQIFSPATYDWRLVEDTAAIGLGTTGHWSKLAGIPAEYLKYDYLGNEWAPDEDGTINAGAVQMVANAAIPRILFDANFNVDGRNCTNLSWICSDVYPTQYLIKPIVPDGKTFYCYERTKSTTYNWESQLVYPMTNGTLHIVPPPSQVLPEQTYTAKYAAGEIWVDPSENGSDAVGDGTEAAPYQTLQKAVDSVVADYTVIRAKRGDYASGGNVWSNLLNRVDFFSTKNDMHIFLRSEEGPDVTSICGAIDKTTLDNENEPGCGPNAARCVLLGKFAAVQGFTLKNGRTMARDAETEGGTSDSGKNGAAVYQYYSAWHPIGKILDCVIADCVGVDSIVFWGSANRCRFTGNTVKSTIFNRGLQVSCLVDGNTCLGYLNNNTYTYLSTFAENTVHPEAEEFVNWYGSSYVYNSIFSGGRATRTAKADVGNFAWKQGSVSGLSGASFSDKDPLLASADDSDFRPFFFSPVVGGVAAADEFYAFAESDFKGGALAFAADGKITAGCFHNDLPSAYVLTSKSGDMSTHVLEMGGAVSLEMGKGSAVGDWSKGSLSMHKGVVNVLWSDRGNPFSFSAKVEGEGTLAVTVNGVELGVLDSLDSQRVFEFRNNGTGNLLSFAFAGDGVAVLSGFKRNIGFAITLQ